MNQKYPPRAMTPDRADLAARMFVNGAERHSKSGFIEPITGAWSPRFANHPWAIEGDINGWGKELRVTVIMAVRRRLMGGMALNDINVDDVMPELELVDYWRAQYKKFAEAEAWREANPDHKSIKGNVAIDVEGLLRRYGFKKEGEL